MELIKNEKNMVVTGLVLIIILGIISYNLYYSSNIDINGNELNCFDTIKNVFGVLPIVKEVVDIIDVGIDKITDTVDKSIAKVTKKIPNMTKKKEVFNVDNNDFTFEQAGLVCKAYDSELATFDQVVESYNKGGNWCNYGWSAGGLALFPTQQKFYDKLQEGPEKYRKSCGKPGVNGGKFNDKNLKFGANCYGFRPKPDKNKIIYNSADYPLPEMQKDANIENEKIEALKRKIKAGEIEVRPFSNKKWSNYSFKNSSYMLTPRDSKDESEIINVEDKKNDESKNPQKIDNNENIDVL